MPSSPRRRVTWRALAPLSTLVLLGSLVACGSDDEPDAAPSPSASESADETPSPSPSETRSESAGASPSESATPSASSTPTESAPSTPSTPSTPGTLREALLPAGELPGLNAESSWTAGRTGAVGTQPFGWCAQFDALTIGAREGVQRQFRSGDDRAGQQVLDFVDETNAVRAERVFRSWHQDCRRGNGVAVRPIQQVDAGGATAWWYLSSTGRAGGQWESFGLARSGNRVTLLRMQHAGQDHSYPRGQDPLELGLQTAASRLG